MNGNPEKSVVNKYTLELETLKILNLNEKGVLSWSAEVVANTGISEENTDFFEIGKSL